MPPRNDAPDSTLPQTLPPETVHGDDRSGDAPRTEVQGTLAEDEHEEPVPPTESSPPLGKMEGLRLDLSDLSTATPEKKLPAPPPPPVPPSDDEKPYLDPPPAPGLWRRPSAESADQHLEGQSPERSEMDKESTSEIQSIMDQFTEDGAPTKEEIMSPRHEVERPILGGGGHFPPRKSSLEPIRSRDMDSIASSPVVTHHEKFPSSPPPIPPKPEAPTLTSESTASLSNQPPPPDPEPDRPFDFHRFLEQLRHKSADPVAGFLRSFLTEFGKRQWMVHEQVKIISDFLAFITIKMAQCDVWREVSETEFDNAKEGMEKLVMNRLYSQTFSPTIPAAAQASRVRGKRRDEKSLGPGRRGQHQEDVERDDILAQKIRIYSWVREEHLEIPSIGPSGEQYLKRAQQELLKIKGYRAPRDKVICVLNCCKVIFGLLKNTKTDTSADSFVPLLIYVVLQANPEHLVSNIQYILRFRNQDKLGGEAGYYLSSLSGAIQFIESLDRTTLTVSDEEFERNVELAVSAIAEQNREAESSKAYRVSDKSSIAEPELTPRNSLDYTSSSPGKSTRPEGSSYDGGAEEAVTGLLRTIQRPLSAIGRILSDTENRPETKSQPNTPARLSPAVFQPPRSSSEDRRVDADVTPVDARESAARQTSAEADEARRIQRQEHRNMVETLHGMFPNLDKEVIDDVVRQKQGRVGLAVDACLALTAGT